MYKLVTIESVCEVIAGQSPPSSSYNQQKDGIPFFQGKADFNEKYPSVRYWCNAPKKISRANDILMSVRAPVGAININNIEACIGRGLAAIRCGEKIDLIFLFHFLKFQRRKIEDLGTGSTFKAITIKTLKSIEIPLPPLKTQQRIAGILDNAAALRDKTAQLLTEYDLLAQSIFLEMFGDPRLNEKEWKTKPLIKVCGVGSSRRVFVDELVESGIPFYRGKEIGNLSNGIEIDPDLFITQEHYNALVEATGAPQIGDLLLPSICPDGRIFRVPDESPFYFKDGRVLWIKVDQSKVNSYYLIFFLRELFRTSYANIASGTTFAELKIVALKKIKTLLPPIELQNEFADKIALIEQQKALAKQELQESEDLFHCLLQQAFKGEL
jgi:type I restriction enzyme S subunit